MGEEREAAAAAPTAAPAPAPGEGHQLPPRLRALELFAGIGGWRLALEAALPTGVVADVVPFDSGPHCSAVYEHNFGEPCCRRNIEQLGPRELEGFDIWMMSPPCQPFSTTHEAKQRDLEDKRCAALAHLCGVLPRLERPPRWVALENVKGFRGSCAAVRWRAALAEAGYVDRELLLDLASFGVPNHRTRYYLLAERRIDMAVAPTLAVATAQELAVSEVGESIAHAELLPHGVAAAGPWAKPLRAECEAAHQAARNATSREMREDIFRKLREYFRTALEDLLQHAGGKGSEGDAAAGRPPANDLLDLLDNDWKLLPLPRSAEDALLLVLDGGSDSAERAARAFLTELRRCGPTPGVDFSLAPRAEAETTCRPIGDFLEPDAAERGELVVSRAVLSKPFARGLSYVQSSDVRSFCFTGHYGKVMHKSSGSLLHAPLRGEAGAAPPTIDRNDTAAAFGTVRFFSPKEILNFFGFPSGFALLPDMRLQHQYKVVGNSIAVCVASELIRLLLLGEGGERLSRLESRTPRVVDAQLEAGE